jgi:hypothetical protein
MRGAKRVIGLLPWLEDCAIEANMCEAFRVRGTGDGVYRPGGRTTPRER